MIYEEPEADGLNISEMAKYPTLTGRGHNQGGLPRPLRRRAFYRALKAGKLWAIVAPCKYEETVKSEKYAKVIHESHCPNEYLYILWPQI